MVCGVTHVLYGVPHGLPELVLFLAGGQQLVDGAAEQPRLAHAHRDVLEVLLECRGERLVWMPLRVQVFAEAHV